MFDPSFYHLLYRQCFSIFIIMSLLIMSSWTNKLSVISAENELNMHKTMTRSISHEIRTPLNTAFMGLELLRDDLKYPSRNQAEDNRTHGWIDTVETIREACNISLGILNQLLTFDKLSSGMLKLERKMTPVIDVVNINTKLFRIQAIQAGVTFNVDMSGDDLSLYKNLLLHIDEYKMNQVLRNLLSNAMKFTPRKGTVTVKLKYNPIEQLSFASTASRAEQEGYTQKGIIKLSIVDTGPGVRKEDQKKLFQEYVQINPGELQKGQGSGLGLSISKSIVDLHGGTIGMHSDGPGRGSTFFVELPVYHPKPAGRFGDSFREPNLMNDFSAGMSFRHKAIKRALSMNIVSPLNSPSWRGSRARVNPTVDMKFSPRSDEDLESGTKVSSLVRAITPPPAYLLPRLKHAATAPLVSPRTALYSYTEMHPPRFEEKPTEDGVIQVSSPLAYDRLVQTDPKLCIETPSGCNEKSEAMVHPDPDHPSMKQIQRTNSFGDKFQPISRQSSSKSINNVRDTSSHMLFPISIPSSRFRASTSSRWLADENSKLHFLVVDDSAANRKMLGLLLTREGHTFVDCDDGSTAVELIKKQMERSLQRAVTSPPIRRASTGIIRTNSSLASRKVGQLASSFSKVLSRPSYDVEDVAAVRQIEVTNIEQDNSENNSPVPLDSKKRKESSRHTSIYNSSQSSSNVYGGLEPENIEQAVRDAVDNANNSSSNMLVSTNSQSRLRTSFGGEDVEGLDQEEPIIEIILIDNLMTHMDGPEAARNIRMLGFEGPIVGVTGMMDGDEDGFIANGANLILLKPLTRRSLHAALKSIRATYAGL